MERSTESCESMGLLDYLNHLSLDGHELTETLGQILDTWAQSLEVTVSRLEGAPTETRSFGGHQRKMVAVGAADALVEQVAAIRAFRKTVDINRLNAEMVGELRALVGTYIEASETMDVPAFQRIRYRPALANSVGLDTPFGYRQFQLHHGSVTHIPCDVLVISALLTEEGKVDGQVANGLAWRHGVRLDPDATFLEADPFTITRQKVVSETATFSELLTLWIPPNCDPDNDAYRAAIRLAFSALLASEHLGQTVTRVGLSFLGGHRISDLEHAVATLLFSALDWLKRADTVDTVSLSIFQRAELDAWSAAMDRGLGRGSAVDSDAVIEALRAEVQAALRAVKDGVLEPAARPLAEALKGPGGLCIELVCTFSRTLCEIIVRECLIQEGIKAGGDLLSNIEKLRTSGGISPWISSYMHGLRVFGNKSVHPASKPPRYSPARLESSDLVSTLAAVRCLLEFWKGRSVQ